MAGLSGQVAAVVTPSISDLKKGVSSNRRRRVMSKHREQIKHLVDALDIFEQTLREYGVDYSASIADAAQEAALAKQAELTKSYSAPERNG